MGNEVNSAVWGLLGTVVGAATSIGTTWLASAHSSRLEAQKARDVRLEAARAFQRQTLLELSDALTVVDSRVLDSYRHELSLVRAGNQWGQGEPVAGMAESIVEAFRAVITLAHRVENDPLRVAVVSYVDTLADLLNADSANTAVALRSETRNQFAAISVRIGECLRSYYEPFHPPETD